MPSGTLRVTQFGQGGVNVDANPLDMADNELRSSQNAEHTGLSGRKGGLSTRQGLAQFNTSRLSGAVLGGIEMPVAGTGGAPAAGGGGNNTGSPIPGITGDNLGAGLTIDSSTNVGAATPPSEPLGQSGVLFGGSRLLLIGRHDDDLNVLSKQTGYGWYLTSKECQDDALKITSGSGGCVVGPFGFPVDSTPRYSPASDTADSVNHGQQGYAEANGVLYYGAAFDTAFDVNPTKATLRRYDGHTDSLVCTFPHNNYLVTAVASFKTSVSCVLVKYADGNVCYVAVLDKEFGIPAYFHGRIFKVTGLDAGNYALTEIFNSLNPANGAPFVSSHTTGFAPYVLENFGGNLWFGMWRGHQILDSDLDPYIVQLQGSGFVIANNVSADHSSTKLSDVSCMRPFQGSLFFGYRVHSNDTGGYTPQFAKIMKLDPDGTLTESLNTDDGGTAADTNAAAAMRLFGGNLYATLFNPSSPSTASVKKFDGASWTTVLNFASLGVPLNLGVDDGVLYTWGEDILYSSLDGITWTNRSAHLNANMDSHDHPMSALYGVDQ
jgi:hypothetical protein